jgi:hypothetical protein
MGDGEVQELAQEAWSLSEAARAALQFEISRRGLAVALNLTAPTEDWPPGPITIRRFRDLPDALLAKSILDSASIECFLADENTIRMDWLLSNLLGGVKLWVRAGDADAAELLDQPYLESFDVEGVGTYTQPRCPSCQSFDISFRELIKRVAYASIFLMWYTGLGVLIPLKRLAWKCHSCKQAWEWTDDSPEHMP